MKSDCGLVIMMNLSLKKPVKPTRSNFFFVLCIHKAIDVVVCVELFIFLRSGLYGEKVDLCTTVPTVEAKRGKGTYRAISITERL